MNYLWEIKKPLTASEMAKQLESDGWTNITLCRTVQSLSDNGYLEVAGLEKTTKTYARKLVPSLTKEEYYSSVLRIQNKYKTITPDTLQTSINLYFVLNT